MQITMLVNTEILNYKTIQSNLNKALPPTKKSQIDNLKTNLDEKKQYRPYRLSYNLICKYMK